VKFAPAISMCDPSHYLPLARAAEECGFDSVTVPDGGPWTERISVPYAHSADGQRWWTADTPFLDPWVAIGAMAAVTRRIRFYPSVLKLPVRSPIHIAQSVASAAVLSGGRVALGAGLGWNRDEFAALGIDYAARAARADEALEIIRALLRGGPVSYRGRHFAFEPLQLSPLPPAPVPIYVGGPSLAAQRRAVRHGDGWCSRSPRASEVAAQIPRLRRLLEEAGRAGEPFEITAMCPDARDVDAFRRLRDAGVTEAQVWPWALYGVEAADLDSRRRAVERFAREIIARLD
jgi:probable F420-dependent oxidoreductase